MTIPGLMQSQPLLVSDILRFAAAAHPAREIVSRQIDEPIVTSNYAQLARRAGRLAGALTTMGVRPGERVATLAWNRIRHLELFYAVPGLGAVLNTVNPRLFEDQIAYILEHAEVARLFVESDLVPLVERLAPSVQGLRDVVVLCAADRLPANTLGAISCEALLDGREDAVEWPVLPERIEIAAVPLTATSKIDKKRLRELHRQGDCDDANGRAS